MKNFQSRLYLQITLLFASLCLLAGMLWQTNLIAATIFVSLLVVVQVYGLVRLVRQTNELLTRFLDAFQFDDFNLHIQARQSSPSFVKLEQSMNEVIGQFRQIRAEREQGYRYLEQVIQHTGVAMMAFTPDGHINLINPSAKRLFQQTPLTHLAHLPQSLQTAISAMNHGEKQVLKLSEGIINMQLVLLATEFKLAERAFKLVSFQNIQAEIAATEQQAWHKLIRVMTHEIMNSITSISTVGATLENMFFDDKKYVGADLDPDLQVDALQAIQLIQRRSEGLLQFVESYRSLTQLPNPQLQLVELKKLFTSLRQLFAQQMKEADIHFAIHLEDTDFQLISDPRLLEQVFINLIINAMQALEGRDEKRLTLSGKQAGNWILISVADTGCGIVTEMLEQIFIPFFTSKDAGNGIGLPISRQIVQRLGGEMRLQSKIGEGSTFTVILPA